MHKQRTHRVTGHVFVYDGKRGRTFYAKYRVPAGWAPDGRPLYRQTKDRLGPEWTGKGRPPAGHLTKRMAQDMLQDMLADARKGKLAGMLRTGATFGDAAEDWYRRGKDEQGTRGTPWKPSTCRDHRSALDRHLLTTFRDRPLEAITKQEITDWRSQRLDAGTLSRRMAAKVTAIMHAIYEHAGERYDDLKNPVRNVKRLRLTYGTGINFYSAEEVWVLVRHAKDEQDGAIYLTAAFSGLRMGELAALRWKNIDFRASTIRVEGSVDEIEGVGVPKSGHGRAVPMAEEVAQALARLGQREHFTEPDDFVFPNDVGGYFSKSALRRRYKTAQTAAELKPLRFHDLRHTFGTSVIAQQGVTGRHVQEWLGHADSRTTARYTHYASRSDEAKLISGAFKVEQPGTEPKVKAEP